MSNFRIKLSLFLNYFVFAILLNSVGTVILQVQNNFGISKGSASVLEAFKDLSIAIASFLIASYVVRIGYKKAMLIALGLVSVMCLIIPSVSSFLMTKLLFATVGVSFALIKVSVFATLSLVTKNKKEHLSLMNFLESFFMIGVLAGYFIFGSFVDNDNPESTKWFNVYYILAAIGQVLPGPNIVNMALMIGDRFFGWRGAFAALAGLLALPLAIVLTLAVLYARLASEPVVAGALRGMGAVAAGLIVAMALKLLPTLARNPLGPGLCGLALAATLGAVGGLRWPMAYAVLSIGGAAVLAAWWRLGRAP